jgi:hypothetical protein
MYRVVAFYPATGVRLQTSGVFTATGSNGYCLHSAISGVNAYYYVFNSTVVQPAFASSRASGFPVRCVQSLLFA